MELHIAKMTGYHLKNYVHFKLWKNYYATFVHCTLIYQCIIKPCPALIISMPTLTSTVARQEFICGYLSGGYREPNIRTRYISGSSSFSSKCKRATGKKNLCYLLSLPPWLEGFGD